MCAAKILLYACLLILTCKFNAAYGAHPDGSHSLIVVTVDTAPVRYVSRQIKTLANSSTAAEGYALGNGIPFVAWIRDLVEWMVCPQKGPPG